jgi:cytochrome c oxidase subunit 1
MYDERLARWFFWTNMVGFNITFFPQHFLGLAGMPRRIADYNVIFTEFNIVSSIGALLFGASFLLFAYIVIRTIRAGDRVDEPVWDGARGLEWELSSPPPYHSWNKPPVLT